MCSMEGRRLLERFSRLQSDPLNSYPKFNTLTVDESLILIQ